MRLEDQGTSASLGSHWERSVLENEYMTASSVGHEAAFSNFTLSLLQDTGWYALSYLSRNFIINFRFLNSGTKWIFQWLNQSIGEINVAVIFLTWPATRQVFLAIQNSQITPNRRVTFNKVEKDFCNHKTSLPTAVRTFKSTAIQFALTLRRIAPH
jgi:hypothetical protein